ncbi:MAG: DUF433 domain-containing protein [Acidobacteria bacterium]|nr:DUF433 domain-containing protein [Acidobacteriota bacterium]
MKADKKRYHYDHEEFSEFHLDGGEEELSRHWCYITRFRPTAKDFSLSLKEAFAKAEREVSTITSQRGIMGGSPCVGGTRVPVHLILDAIEYYGTLEGARHSYPHLTNEQIKNAVRFAKIVLDCDVEH